MGLVGDVAPLGAAAEIPDASPFDFGVGAIELIGPFDSGEGVGGIRDILVFPAPFGDMDGGAEDVVFITDIEKEFEAAEFEGVAILEVIPVVAVFMEGDGSLIGAGGAEAKIIEHTGGFPIGHFWFAARPAEEGDFIAIVLGEVSDMDGELAEPIREITVNFIDWFNPDMFFIKFWREFSEGAGPMDGGGGGGGLIIFGDIVGKVIILASGGEAVDGGVIMARLFDILDRFMDRAIIVDRFNEEGDTGVIEGFHPAAPISGIDTETIAGGAGMEADFVTDFGGDGATVGLGIRFGVGDAGDALLADEEGAGEKEVIVVEDGAEFADAEGGGAEVLGVNGVAETFVAVGEFIEPIFADIEEGSDPPFFGDEAALVVELADVAAEGGIDAAGDGDGAALDAGVVDAGEAEGCFDATGLGEFDSGVVEVSGEDVMLGSEHFGFGGGVDEEGFEALVVAEFGFFVSDRGLVFIFEGLGGGRGGGRPIFFEDGLEGAGLEGGLVGTVANDAGVVVLVGGGVALGDTGFKDAGDGPDGFAPSLGIEGDGGHFLLYS